MVNEIPYLTFYQMDVTETADPSGNRHIKGGSFAFERVLSSGVCASGMVFPEITIDYSTPSDNYISTPVAMLFRLDNVSNGSGIDKFRLYISDASALEGDYGVEPTGFVQMVTSGIWQPNCTLPSGIATKMVPGQIPANANVYRQDNKVFINGVGDLDVSQYVYMNVVVPSIQPIGSFGICGSGNLRFCLLYDYADI